MSSVPNMVMNSHLVDNIVCMSSALRHVTNSSSSLEGDVISSLAADYHQHGVLYG